MSDCCEGANCGRSDCPCKQKTLSSREESDSPLNSNGDFAGAEWIDVRNFTDRVVGKDGSYYDCDECGEVGTLLCCDTCPSTFHLECLKPPMETAPSGDWQCQKCWPRDDPSAPASASKGPNQRGVVSRVKHSPSSSILSKDKKQLNDTSNVHDDPKSSASAVKQKLPAASLLSLDKLAETADVLGRASEADTNSENLTKSAICLNNEEGTQSGFEMDELKVNETSSRKINVETEDVVNMGAQSVAASDQANEDHTEKPADDSVGIDETPVEEKEERVVVCQDLNELPYSISVDVIQEKLLIPRDVSQASANGLLFSQNDESSDSLPEEERLSNEESKARKERLACLRARQKARIAQRVKKVGEPAPGSTPSGNEGPVQVHGQNVNGLSGLSNKSPDVVPIVGMPLRMKRHENAGNEEKNQSSEKTDNSKKSFENLSVHSKQKQLNHKQGGFGDPFPGFPTKDKLYPECLPTAGVKRQNIEVQSPWLRTLDSQPRDDYPHKISTSDFFSGYPMPSTGYNSSRTMGSDEAWSNNELDSLWIGIRKYCQGNWLQMLTDPNLCFSRGKTGGDLAKMWEKEKAKHFGPQPTNGKRKMLDLDLNLEPSLQGLKEKSDEAKLLVGIHVEIPVNQPVAEAAGTGANRMQMQQAISGPDGSSTNRMQMQQAASGPGGGGANRMQMQEEAASNSGGNGENRMEIEEVAEVSSDAEVNSELKATIDN